MLSRFCSFVALAAIALPASGATPKQHTLPPVRFNSHDFMRVSEIRPGMRGYALSTFKGTTITRFHIEVLGVISKFNNGKDYILFRALDGPPVTRHLNIAHGMSGSPIYIHGKLAGAISMGLPGIQFPKEPTALATPIEEMFDAWNPNLPNSPAPLTARPDAGAGTGFSNGITTLSASGFTARGLNSLNAALEPFHLAAVPSGGPAGSISAFARSATLQPGSAVGISLVQGDMDLSYTGTVTYRRGNQILMFGHPLFGIGPIDAAMTTAYVVDIFPSYQDSVTLGSPLTTVGRIMQDRPFSVGGVIGMMPSMIPVTVSVDDATSNRQKVMHARVINHPALSGRLIGEVAEQLISDVHSEPGDVMAAVTLDADADEVGHIHRSNLVFDSDQISQSAASDLQDLLRLLRSNPIYPLSVHSVKLQVHMTRGHDTAEIQRMFLRQKTFSPGDTVSVGVVLKPFKLEPVTRNILVKIPENTPPGTLTLSVKGGAADSGGGLLAALMSLQSSATPNVATVPQVVKNYLDKPHNNELVTQLQLGTAAVTVQGEKLTGLPPNFAAILRQNRSTGMHTERDEVKVITPTHYVVSGSQALTITVQRRVPLSSAVPTAPVAPAVVTPVPPAKAESAPAIPDDAASAADTGDGADGDAQPAASMAGVEPGVAWLAAATPTLAAPQASAAQGITHSAKPAPMVSVAPAASPVKIPSGTDSPPFTVVGRQAETWKTATEGEWAIGDFDHLALGHEGSVSISPEIKKRAETHASTIWQILPAADGAFVATGSEGKVFHISPTGTVRLAYDTKDLEATALAQDTAGNIYVAAAPSGVVTRITPAGHATAWFTAPSKYVTALAWGSNGTLYAATGGGTGSIYALSTEAPGGKAIFTSSQQHLLSLAAASDGTLYAGSASSGIVYALPANGKPRVFWTAKETDINHLAVASNGDVIVGTGPQGSLYRISPTGEAQTIAQKLPAGVTGVASGRNGEVWAISDSILYRISIDNTLREYSTPLDEQFVALAHTANDEVLLGTNTVADLYAMTASSDASGTYTSAVRDAGGPAHWGTISWLGSSGPTDISVETRTGDVSEPDTSWSGWSAPAGGVDHRIVSPTARYLQYRIHLHRSGPAKSPILRTVRVTYLAANRPPVVTITSPQGGDYVSKSVVVRWAGSDPDRDTLTYSVYQSHDNGLTWTKLNVPGTNVHVAPSAQAAQQTREANTKLQTELSKHPEIPAFVRDQILAQDTVQRAASSSAASAADAAAAAPLRTSSFTWDTTHVPDGVYMLKVSATDAASNPSDARTAESVSAPFVVTNKSPEVTAVAHSDTTAGSIAVSGSVRTSIAPIVAVQVQVDKLPAQSAAADDGIFDSTHESFQAMLTDVPPGHHTITVQALDRAGNWSTQVVPITITK